MPKDTRCPLPFLQFLLDPSGNVSPCGFNQVLKITDIKNKNFEQIWNHPNFQKLRHEILNGDYSACESHINTTGCNLFYERFRELVNWKSIQTNPPYRIDVRLNGKCNIECIMCDVWKAPNHQYDNSFFWSDGPTKIFPFIKEVLVLGGEPFIQKDTYRLMTEIQKVNKDCHWIFFTNGQWKWTQQLQDYFDLMSKMTINLSLDSPIPETYETLRKKGSFKTAQSNLDSWISYRHLRNFDQPNTLTIRVSFLISKLNWQQIPLMYEYCQKKNVSADLQYLETPSDLSIASASKEEKALIKKSFTAWSDKIPILKTQTAWNRFL